jgi:hypothetical protein
MVALIQMALVLSTGRSDPTVYAAFGAGAGAYLFYRGFHMLQRKRLILNTPSSKIRSASMGLVEISGLATGPFTIPAPITNYPCFWHRTLVWQMKQSGKSKSWSKVVDERLFVPFYLEDNTGQRVLIDPRGADMEIHRDFQEEYSDSLFSSDVVPENIRHFLACRGVDGTAAIKIEEYCIKPKNALFILGTLAENTGVDLGAQGSRTNLMGVVDNPDFKSAGIAGASSVGRTGRHSDAPATEQEIKARAAFAAAMGFHMPGSLQASLLPTQLALTHSAAPHPTVGSPASAEKPLHPAPPIDEAEKHRRDLFMASLLGTTGSVAPNLPLPTTQSHSAATSNGPSADTYDLQPPMVLMKGSHNPEFFISWRSQRDVVSELNWKSAAYIWGGPILTLICVGILLARFGVL